MIRLPSWVEEYGYDDAICRRLWALIDVPERPYGLPRVLSVFESSVDVVLEVVDYADANALRALSARAREIRNSVNERDDLPYVHVARDTLRGYYDRYPLYAMMHHPVPESPRDQPYLFLTGIMILIAPLITDERNRVRYATYCRAVRTLGEQALVSSEEKSEPPALTDHLRPALDGTESPGVCLGWMRGAARSTQYFEQAQVLCQAWHRLISQNPARAHTGHRGGRRGFQPVLGIRAGPHHTYSIVPPRALDSECSTLVRVDEMAEADGPGLAGEARGDAGTTGSADPGVSDDGHSVPYFDRATMYQHRRHVYTRRRNRAQDTILAATVWTPVQAAQILQVVLAMFGDKSDVDADLSYGAALVLIGLVTGVDRDTLAGIDYRPHLPDAIDPGMVVTADGWMAWRPTAGQSVLRPPTSPARAEVRPAVRWVTIPRPGVLAGIDDVLAQNKCRDRRTAYTRVLKTIGRRLGFPIKSESIRRHWWGWMAGVRGQPVVASAMTGYVRPSSEVPMHYLHISPHVQQSTYAEAYGAFARAMRAEYLHAGVPWMPSWDQVVDPAAPTTAAGYGSPIVPVDDALPSGLRKCVDRADLNAQSANEIEVNRTTIILYHLVTLACGLRPVRIRASHAALLLRGFSVISDKDTARYAMARHAPLSPRLRRSLVQLWRHREKLLYASGVYGVGHLPNFPDVPNSRQDLILELAKPVSGLSLLWPVQRSVLELERPYRLRVMGLDLDLPTSWQRHWLRTAILEAGLPDQQANLRLGHACIGQDPYDPDSCIRPGDNCQAAGESVEEKLERILEKLIRRL